MKASNEFWETALGSWQGGFGKAASADSSKKTSTGRARESWETTAKTWRAMATVMGEPGAMDGVFKGLSGLPDIVVKLIQPAWNGLFHLQKEWAERAGRIGESSAAYSFDNLDQEAFRAWTQIYDKEFRQFLKIPQLGLTRSYQERLQEATDKFNIFQTTMAEFVSLLYLPIEKSFKVQQDKLSEMAEAGRLPTNSKDYYKMWVKILEGHYMNLFQSPEYAQTLARTLNAVSDFTTARHGMLQDALQFLPLPNQKDMDELYREIYLLKKRINALEKKNQNQGKTDDM